MFPGKNILVGVAGGIAAYKSAYLVREFKKASANVRVMMTQAAQRFVSPLTFETLSDNKVALDLFGDVNTSPTAHIDWARWPDIIVISPATANTIGKIANGIADNFMTTTIMATTAPVLLCPAMNVEMYNNRLYRQNAEKLARLGFHFVEPEAGDLACGEVGMGRLADAQEIVRAVHYYLNRSDALSGKKILVTAGPTHEAFDPVRYMTNKSSGKMGFALAQEAAIRGGEVTLIAGPNSLQPPYRVKVVGVASAEQMAAEVKKRFDDCDVLIMAAAVADYRPTKIAKQKIKKTEFRSALEVEPTEDILQAVGRRKAGQFIVGFALETENQLVHAIDKMQRKNCDLIVLNDPLEEGAGFEVDTNKVIIIDRNKRRQETPLMSKQRVAQKILDAVQDGLRKNG